MSENEEIEKKINDNYKVVTTGFSNPCWLKEEKIIALAAGYEITEKTTSIKLYDVEFTSVDNKGDLINKIADTMEFTLYHKDEICKTLNQRLQPKYDFILKLTMMIDGTKYIYDLNLKYLSYKRVAYHDKARGLEYSDDRTKTMRIYISNDIDIQYLSVYMYILMVNNFFDEASKAREERVNQSLNANNTNKSNNINNNYFTYNNSFSSLFQMNTSSSYRKSGVDSNIDPYKELEGLIGLDSIKRDIKQLTSFIKIQQERKAKGLSGVPVSLHLVFTGNPGTGKTTIARILAKIYKDIGVLSKGHMVEVDRSGLVAEYIGQTAPKTMQKINEAKGGILFIDEAYTLANRGEKDFGQEAIDTLLKAMEDRREDFIVIVAGYPELMDKFINSNPGLQSRFNKFIYFEDYNEDEMFQIFNAMCKKYDYILDDYARTELHNILNAQLENKNERFANARTVRNIFETAITRQSSRLADIEHTDDDMKLIKKEDLSINEP